MANTNNPRNVDAGKNAESDISHMFLVGAYYTEETNMRNAKGMPVSYGTDHPVEGKQGQLKRIGTGKAAIATTPTSNLMKSFPSNPAWQRSAGVSLDGLFVPFSTTFKIVSEEGSDKDANVEVGTHEYFPTFERPFSTLDPKGVVKDSIDNWWHNGGNAFGSLAGNFSYVTSASLNPYASGHSISAVVKNKTIGNPSISAGGYAGDAPQQGSAEGTFENVARPMGLRGPMVMAGWGYDTDGMPVPNARFEAERKDADPESHTYGMPVGVHASEKFKSTSSSPPQDHKHFLPYYMSRQDQWKAGPIDLRWDRDRKVWVGGQFNQIYLTKATRCILPETGMDGANSFHFGVGGLSSPGRLYRNPCPTQECKYTSYFPKSMYYPDIEIFDPEDHAWCGRCRTYGSITACSDFKDGCQPFYHGILLRSVHHQVGSKNAPSNCTDKFRKSSGGYPGNRRAGNPCHGWGDSYFGNPEGIGEKIADGTMTERARSMLYQKVFLENPLGQGLMVGDSFFSYDTGKKITYEYTRTDAATCGQKVGKPITVKETIPVHIILQGEFYGMEIISNAGCERGSMTACTRKFFAQGFATAEDCGPDDDYPRTAAL